MPRVALRCGPLLLTLLACTPPPLAGEGSETSSETSSETGESEAPCADRTYAACEAAEGCRPLLAGTTAGSDAGLCLVSPVDVACVPADSCAADLACFACPEGGGTDDQVWVEDCSCLPPGWSSCGAAIDDPQICECEDSGQCHPAEQCVEGQCQLCGPSQGCSGCDVTGCPSGYCCGHGGDCLPNGACGEDPPDCTGPGCGVIDVLIVVDDSASMGEEQRALHPALDTLLADLDALEDSEGEPLAPNVNIMVTSTDMGHPLCEPLPEGDQPLAGAPQTTACVDRLAAFEPGGGAPSAADACVDSCPVAVTPVWPHIHFEGPPGNRITNIPGNNVAGALHCLAPQGIVGCGYSSPLEAMLAALDPEAAWNQGSDPFLRDDAEALAIVVVTDSYDCSVRAPEGHAYFVDAQLDTYWNINPETGTKTGATEAVCWNAGVDCEGPNQEGVFSSCAATDTGVLQPVSRYRAYLEDELVGLQDKQVVMLGVLGVPEAGVGALVYREWNDAPYPAGDILPGAPDAAEQTFLTGVGPGCTGEDGRGGFTGQATPPVRMREVCESLDEAQPQGPRCCLASVCGTDFSGAFACLPGMLQPLVSP